MPKKYPEKISISTSAENTKATENNKTKESAPLPVEFKSIPMHNLKIQDFFKTDSDQKTEGLPDSHNELIIQETNQKEEQQVEQSLTSPH